MQSSVLETLQNNADNPGRWLFRCHLAQKHTQHTNQQVTIQSSSLETLDTTADNPGRWLFHCHLNDHMDGGMLAMFKVSGTAPEVSLDGKVGDAG